MSRKRRENKQVRKKDEESPGIIMYSRDIARL